MHTESDRGCILIACHVLDVALGHLLRSKFVRRRAVIKRAIDPLFEVSRPLSSFWAKTNLAYALGLLDDWAYQDLQTIRNLRNALAHSYRSFSFDAPDIQSLLHQFQAPRRAMGHPYMWSVCRTLQAVGKFADKWDAPRKTANQCCFIAGFHYLHGYLTNGRAYKNKRA